VRQRLRRFVLVAGAPARWALRTYWGSALLLVAAGGAGLVALLPVASLTAARPGIVTRLGAPLLRAADLGLGRSSLAAGPNELRRTAVTGLFRLLVLVSAGVLCVAALSLLAVAFARGRSRVPELVVRRAVGGSRRLILAAALIEGVVLAVATLAWGGGAGAAGAGLAVREWPGPFGQGTLTPGFISLLAITGLVLFAVLLPLASMRPRAPLATRSARALELVVPTLQLGLSLTVLAAASLLARHANRLRGRVPVDGGGVVYGIASSVPDPVQRAGRYADLMHRLKALPGVDGASLTSPDALLGLGQTDALITDCGQCGWGGIYVRYHTVNATQYLVSADTFRMMGLRVTAGRSVSERDGQAAPPIAVVSQSLAAAHFQNQRAVGRSIQVGHAPARWYTVVGVVADQLPAGFGGGFQPPDAVYLSVLQHPIRAVDVLVRGDSRALAAADDLMRRELGGGETRTARTSESRLLAAEAAPIRWFGRVFGLEGWIMLAVATIGTFVVLRLWVTSLLHELGVRRAVGARRRHLYGFVFARALGIALGGVAIGCWCGALVWGTLTSLVAGLPVWDSGIAERFGLLLTVAALAGAFFPAWQASRAAPAALVGREGL
jgi:putative ABC transport system permease protein